MEEDDSRVAAAWISSEHDKAQAEQQREDGHAGGKDDDDLSSLADYYARTLISPPPPAPTESPSSSPHISPASSAVGSPFSSSPSPLTPSFFFSAADAEDDDGIGKVLRREQGRRASGGSMLRASAPPFTAGSSSSLRGPSGWTSTFQPPLLPSSRTAWPQSDPTQHSMNQAASTPSLSQLGFTASAARSSTPATASTLSAFSSPFTPASAPPSSRSIRRSSAPQGRPAQAHLPFPSAVPFAAAGEGAPVPYGELDVASLPVLPFDVPSDRELLCERSDHASYMFCFRTSVCALYAASLCPHDAYTCFSAHAKHPRRRKPLLQHGRYSYIPTRCRYLLEDRDCPKGAQCRFAHSTEEVIYHPSKYKTQLCSHPLDASGCCTGYGRHCAKAHGEADRRLPVYEAEEGQQRRWTMDDFVQFACPQHEREQERLFYQFVYKTRRCAGFPWNCQCDALDYHRDEERRRGPAIRYAPMACPNVKPFLNAEWGDPNVDCSGRHSAVNAAAGAVVQWDCEYAHTLLELMYHPQVYKTSLCVARGQLVALGCGAGVEVERIKVGQRVMAWDAKAEGMVMTEVRGVVERQHERECVELLFEDGRVLLCTPDHQVLTVQEQWMEARELSVGESRVVMSTPSPLLFPSSLYQDAATRSFSYALGVDPRYQFSCNDDGACFRLCAVARLLGLLITARVDVDEDGRLCRIFHRSRLDAARCASDIELLTSHAVRETRLGAVWIIQLPASLACALQLSARPSTRLLPSLLTDASTPDDVFKECVAGFLGGGCELTVLQAELGAAPELRIRFGHHLDVASFHAAASQLSALLLERGFPTIHCDADAPSADCALRVYDAAALQRRFGIRYNADTELLLSMTTARGSQLVASTSPSSNALPPYTLLLVARRPVGPRRVYDVQVTPSLHSFLCSGVVVHNCDHVDETNPHTWKCVWKRRCAHAHGRDDLKNKERAADEWKQHLAVIGPVSAQRAPSLYLPASLQPPGATLPAQNAGHGRDASSTLARHSRRQSRTGDDRTHALTAPSPRPASETGWSETEVRDGGSNDSQAQLIVPKRVSTSSLPLVLYSPLCPSDRGALGVAVSQRLSLFDLAAPASSPSLWEAPYDPTSSPQRDAAAVPPVMSEELIAAMQSSFDAAVARSDSTAQPSLQAAALARRTPSPPSTFSSPLLSAASVLAAQSDSGLVPLSSDKRLAYDPSHVLSVGKNGQRLYAGYCTRAEHTASRGHCGVKLIDKTSMDDAMYAHIRRQVDAIIALTQDSTLPQLVCYLDKEEDAERLCVAIELRPEDIPLHDALPSILQCPPQQRGAGGALDPVGVIRQLLSAVSALHSRQISHGDISPRTIFVDPALRHAHLGDVALSRQPTAAVEPDTGSDRVSADERSADVYAIGCVSYYVLSAGRMPFQHAGVEFELWADSPLTAPFDSSLFNPTAAHFVAHLLLTPPSLRLTADRASLHPLFWPAHKSTRFLCTVSHWIDHVMTAGAADTALYQEAQEFCSDLEALGPSIFPAPQRSHAGPGAAEWGSSVHSSLHQWQLLPPRDADVHSVLGLLRFMHATLRHLLHAPVLSCLVHALFHLDHRSNCTRPRRGASQHHLQSQSQSRQQPQATVDKAEDDSCAAVGSYFFARFPSLLVSVYHLVHKLWQTQPALAPFFRSQPDVGGAGPS